eukprot:767108-Hanusia_phi.AAC.12
MAVGLCNPLAGVDEENEWLDVDSHRIRVPQEGSSSLPLLLLDTRQIHIKRRYMIAGDRFPSTWSWRMSMSCLSISKSMIPLSIFQEMRPHGYDTHVELSFLLTLVCSKTAKTQNKPSKKSKQAGLSQERKFHQGETILTLVYLSVTFPQLSWIDRLGEGWERLPKDDKGCPRHYMYVSPDGQTFQTLALAQQHAESSMTIPVNAADPFIPKVRKKSGGAYTKAYLRDFEEKWHQKKYHQQHLIHPLIVPAGTKQQHSSGYACCHTSSKLRFAFRPPSEGGKEVIEYMKKKTWDEADFKKAMFSQEVVKSRPCWSLHDGVDAEQGRLCSHWARHEDQTECPSLTCLAAVSHSSFPQLIDAGHLRFPVIFFSPNLKLSANVKQREACKRTLSLNAVTGNIQTQSRGAKERSEVDFGPANGHSSDHRRHPRHEGDGRNVLSPGRRGREEVSGLTCLLQLDRQKTKKEAIAYVHWWFYPDSYDEWLPEKEVEGEMCATSLRKFWKVCFNEWMTEDDYLPDDPEDDVAEAVDVSTCAMSV